MIKTWKERIKPEYHRVDRFAMAGMQAEIDELRAENAKLRVALEKAADDIEAWGAYASEYFQKKHNLQRDIDAARAALGEKS